MKHLQNALPDYTDAHSAIAPFDIRNMDNTINGQFGVNNFLQRDGHFLIIWISKGQGSYYIDQQKGVIADNHLLFIKPGQLNSIQLADHTQGYIFSFTLLFMDAADRDGGSAYGNFHQVFARTQAMAIDAELLEDMESIATIMLKEFTRHNLFRSDILKRYFKIFLIYLSGQFGRQAQLPHLTRNEEILHIFMEKLEANFRSQKMVAYYADSMAVTANYLNEVIKKMTGSSAGYHIRQRVALEAKRQAAHPNSCMKSTAYDLGFFDMAHFSKFFKNATGINFSDFKNNGRIMQAAV